MKSGIIKMGFIKKTHHRIDGLSNLSDGLRARTIINKYPYGILHIQDIVLHVYCPGIFARHYVKRGTTFVGGADIIQTDYNTKKYLCEKTTPNHEILKLKRGWTLVTCGGTIGNCVFTNSLLAKCWASQHVMRVIPKNYPEGILYAYLASKYGKMLLTTNIYGSVIPTINADSIKAIPIPNFSIEFQKEVDDLIQESARLREDAADALEEAKKTLEDYINFPFEPTNGFKASNRTLSDIRNSLQLRMDPPALMNNSVLAFEKLKNRTQPLGKCKINIWRPGIFKRSYVANGIPYIKGSEIFDCNPFTRCEHLSKTKTPFLESQLLHDRQILVTCAGSVGLIKFITKEYDDKKAMGSQDIIRIESFDELITSEYLYAYLRLPLVYDYILSMKYGSVIERVEPFHIESIPIIMPTEELSKKITNLIKEYSRFTYEAFCKEEKAITMVEAEIEKWSK